MTRVNRDQVQMLLDMVRKLKSSNDENKVQKVIVHKFDNFSFTLLNVHGLKYLLQLNETLFKFDNSSILDSTTDLISGVYEGGFKVWECSIDLLRYLLENEIIKPGQKVCDLGCGAGILGIFALMKMACLVHFLDYNREVLDWFTLPNLLNNLTKQVHSEDDLLNCVLEKTNFYPGDWTNVDKELGEVKYDVILTSETIYKKENYPKLLNLMKNHLNTDGKVLVGTKVYYFGLDGGCFDFIEFVEKDQSFNVEVVKTINENLQRNILLLTFKHQAKSS